MNEDTKDKLSRRNFLQKSFGASAFALAGKHLRQLAFPTQKIDTPEKPVAVAPELAELSEDFTAGPDQLVSVKSDARTLLREYFKDRLTDEKLQICSRLFEKIASLSTFAKLKLRSVVQPDLLEQFISFAGNLPPHLNQITDLDKKKFILELFDKPAMVIQLIDIVYELTKKFDQLTSDTTQRLAFSIDTHDVSLFQIDGAVPQQTDYQYRKQLKRYEPTDVQPNYELLPEIQAVIDKAAETFGIPPAILTAILVIETGGGKDAPGSVLSIEQQKKYIASNMRDPDMHFESSAGALGPTQMLQSSIDTFKFADNLVWGNEAANNIHNLKTAFALAAAKIYVDTLALKDVEQFRYTSMYEDKRIEKMSKLYTFVKEGLIVAQNIDGMKSLLESRGKLEATDIDHICLATIYYHGSNDPYPRLGNRSYDQFVRAYVQGNTLTPIVEPAPQGSQVAATAT